MDKKELQAEFEKLKKAAIEEFQTTKKELNEDYFNEENKEKLQEIEKKAFDKFDEIVNSNKKNIEDMEAKVEDLTDSEKDEVKELGKKAQKEYEEEMAKIKEEFEKAKKAAEEKRDKAAGKAEELKDDAKAGLEKAGEKVKEAAETVKEKTEPAREKVKEGLEKAGAAIKETAENVKEKVEEKTEPVKEKVEEKTEEVKEKVEEKTEPVKEKAEEVKEDADDKFKQVKEGAEDKGKEVKKKAEDKKEELKDEFQKIEKNVKTKGGKSIFSKILTVIIAIILLALICTGVAYYLSKRVSPQDTLRAAILRTQGEYNTVTITAGKVDDELKPKSVVEYFGRNGDVKLVSQINLDKADKAVMAINANVKKDGKELINYRAEVVDNAILYGYKTASEEKIYKTEADEIKMTTGFLTAIKNHGNEFNEIVKYAKENEKEAYDKVIASYNEFVDKSIVEGEDKIAFEDAMVKRVIGVKPHLESYKKLAANVQELVKKDEILTRLTDTINKITKESEAENKVEQDEISKEDLANMIDGLLEEVQNMNKAEEVSEDSIIYVYVEPFTSKLSKVKVVSDLGEGKKAELIVKYSKSRISENLDREKAQKLEQPQFALMEYLINEDMLKAYEEIAKEEGITAELKQEVQQRIQSSKQIQALYNVFKQGMNGNAENNEEKEQPKLEEKKEEAKEKVEEKKQEAKEKTEEIKEKHEKQENNEENN